MAEVRPHLLMVPAFLGGHGGLENHVLATARTAARAGYRVSVVTPRPIPADGELGPRLAQWAEVDDVEPYRTRLLEAVDAVARKGLGEDDVERCRRRAWGGWLRAFNSPERTASLHLGMALKDARPEDALAALEGTTVARANARLRELAARPRAWSVLLPRGAG